MLHCILVKWHEDAGPNEELSRRAEALFSPEHLPEHVRLHGVHRAVVEGDGRCDLMICLEVDGRPGLAAFDRSDFHRRWKAEFGPAIAQKTIFDCEGSL